MSKNKNKSKNKSDLYAVFGNCELNVPYGPENLENLTVYKFVV